MREGIKSDAVLGVIPSIVVTPQSVDEVAGILAWANERGLKVAPCGSRTKLDRGAPPTACDILLDLSNLTGVVEHAAADMTVTVLAGTRLEELQATLAKEGQFLALDPPIPGTVGGLIATADTGPRRLRYGGVRDLILGVTFVRADGIIARGGGKVVKNVAGYDMPKLLTGSLGTLGVVVQSTFRLHPLPTASSAVAKRVASAAEAWKAARQVLHSILVPTSVDYFSDPDGEDQVLAVRFESSPRSVEAQAQRASELLGGAGLLDPDTQAATWSRLDDLVRTDPADVLARLIAVPSDLPHLLASAQEDSARSGIGLSVVAHLGHGHALLRWHSPAPPAVVDLLRDLRGMAEGREGNLVLWRAPAEVRSAVDVWGNPGDGIALMRRIKAELDPKATLNPGRFVGGI